MWDARNYFEPYYEDYAEQIQHQVGYVFTCPACGEKLDMVFRTLPYSTEFRKKCIEQYKYDPQDNVWDEDGSLRLGTLSLHPSIVHMGCKNGGHYWIRDGKIINC